MKKLLKGLSLSLFCLLAGWTAYIANNGNGVNQDVELSDVEALAIAQGESSEEQVIPCWSDGFGVLCKGTYKDQCTFSYISPYTGREVKAVFDGKKDSEVTNLNANR